MNRTIRIYLSVVFPAHAGVIPKRINALQRTESIPRTRGGDPKTYSNAQEANSIPRTRGGDPALSRAANQSDKYSPHTRG